MYNSDKEKYRRQKMAEKLIMTFNITIDRSVPFPSMESVNGAVTMIPFGGSVDSELFKGRVLPGATDVQVTNSAGVRHMLAQYMFEGVDCEGVPCKLFVKNDGFFMRGMNPSPFETTPTFMTDSKALAPYLHKARFRGEGHPSEAGVDIKIFDIEA